MLYYTCGGWHVASARSTTARAAALVGFPASVTAPRYSALILTSDGMAPLDNAAPSAEQPASILALLPELSCRGGCEALL